MRSVYFTGVCLLFCAMRFSASQKSDPIQMDSVRFQYAIMEKEDSLYGGMYNVLYYFTDSATNRKGIYNLVCMFDHTSGEYIYRGVSKSYHSDSLPANFPGKVIFNSEYTWKFKGNTRFSLRAIPNEKSKLKINASVYRKFPNEKTTFQNYLQVYQYQAAKIKMKLNSKEVKATRALQELSFTDANRFLHEEHRKIIISFTAHDRFYQINAYMNQKGELESSLSGVYDLNSTEHTSTNRTLWVNSNGNSDFSNLNELYRCFWNITDLEKKTDVSINLLPVKQLVNFYKKSFWLGFARVKGQVNGKPYTGYASVIMN